MLKRPFPSSIESLRNNYTDHRYVFDCDKRRLKNIFDDSRYIMQ